MDIRAAEISKVIKDQIANFGTEAQVSEVGSVLSTMCRLVKWSNSPMVFRAWR
jgi:F0F1-type ATP synthase alpha subunit